MEIGALLSKFQNKLHDFAMRGNKIPDRNCRFYGIRCHGNEINTCDFPERKF